MKNKLALKRQPELFSTTITKLSHDGRGIGATSEGKTVFVSGALPGETVSYRLAKKSSRFNEGNTIDILTASPERVIPPCENAGICGGCSMQHIAVSRQIDLKQTILLEQLKHFGRVEAEMIMPPISGSSQGYRRKARLSVHYKQHEKKLVLGFREKSSNRLANIKTCTILHPSVSQHLTAMAEMLSTLEQCEHIPQIEVAVGDRQTALVFRHLSDLPASDREKLIAFGRKHMLDIYLQPNSPLPVHCIWPQNSTERLSYALPAYDVEMQFHPLDFTQINAEINLLMVQRALELLEPQPTDNVLDLFCGLGNFSLPLARYAQHVTGIEGHQDMVQRATTNANSNDITNTSFHVSNLDCIPAARPTWMQKQYTKILLDPPRAGAEKIIALFPKFAPQRIVYVSCNPATLARDAGELVHQQGYKLKKIGVINMFPHTSHIEAIALFEK